MFDHHCGSMAIIVVSLGATAIPQSANATEIRRPFNINAGPAAQSIAEFARQARISVLTSGDIVAGIHTNQVRGTYAVLDALDQLLAGTGLTSKTTGSGAIFIVPGPEARSAEKAKPAVAGATPNTPPPILDSASGAVDPVAVIVSGTRLSIESAIERKKLAPTVLDAIAAEDIGQFPDKNVAEALSRVSGVQMTYSFGEGNQISIRGVQPDLNRVEIDGMSVLATADSGSRAPELREIPSELIKSIDVIKGVVADATEGSLGGTVSVKTNKPLDFKRFTIAATGSAEQNSLRGGAQPRGNFLIADRFLDGRLGLMANVVYDKVLTQADRVRNTGWSFLRDWDLSPEKTVPSLNPVAAAVSNRDGCATLTATNRSDCERQWYDYSPAAPRYGIWRRDHQRTTGQFTAQFRVDQGLNAYASYLRLRQQSRFSDLNYQTDLVSTDRLAQAGTMPTYNASGVPSGGSCVTPGLGSTPAGVVVTAHRVTEYVVGDCVALAGKGGANAFSTQARDFRQQEDTYYRSAGFDWHQGQWQVEGMLTRSNGNYSSDTNFIGMTMNAPGLKVSLDQQGFPHFTFPTGLSPTDQAAYTQVQFNYSPVELNTFEDQAKLDLRYRTRRGFINRVSFGAQARNAGIVRYADGGYVLNAGNNLTSTADDLDVRSSSVRYSWNFDPLNPTAALRPTPAQPFIDATSKDLWVSGPQMQQLIQAIHGTSPTFLAGSGLSGFPANWVVPNYTAAIPFFDTSSFSHDLLRQAPGRDGNIYPQIPSYGVEERTRAAYLRLDFEDALQNHLVEGNLGLRYASTDTASTGRFRVLQRIARSPESALYDDRVVSNAIIVKSSRYHDLLPSLNAAAWLIDDSLVLRLGYGKVMARPSLDRLNPNFNCVINSGKVQFGGDGVDDCTGGNPDLQPYRAANKDISLEWYPRRGSQLSLAYFRKDINTSILNNAVVRKDLLGDGTLFDVTTTVNGPGATTSGIELAGRTALTALPGVLGGLGLDASFTRMAYSYARGRELVNLQDGSQLPFPGMSRTAYNLALWYDQGPVNARLAYSWRARYYTGSNDTSTGNPLFDEPSGFLDAKMQFRLTQRLSFFFEAKNLTDERTLTTAGALSRPTEYSWSGRRYFLGLGYTH